MPKQIRHDKDVILNSFQNPFLNFDIHLAFDIWILKFGFSRFVKSSHFFKEVLVLLADGAFHPSFHKL